MSSLSLTLSVVVWAAASAAAQEFDDLVAAVEIDAEGTLPDEEDWLRLQEFFNDPIDLNRASRAELERVPFLEPSEIARLLRARRERDRFASVTEAVELSQLSPIASRLLPSIAVTDSSIPVAGTISHRWISDANGGKVATRFAVGVGAWKGGGAQTTAGAEDFSSTYALAQWGPTTIVFGDHTVRFGHSLLFGPAARTVKGRDTPGKLIRPSFVVDGRRALASEGLLRGIAAHGRFSGHEWLASIFANPFSSQSNNNWERERGAVLGWRRSSDHLQGAVLVTHWQEESSTPSDKKEQRLASVSFEGSAGEGSWFAEIAAPFDGKVAGITGLHRSSRGADWMVSLRKFPRGFRSPRSEPLREWSSAGLNESGVYQLVRVKTGRHFLTAFGDLYAESSASSDGIRPRSGHEAGIRWEWNRGEWEWIASARDESKRDGTAIIYADDPLPVTSRRLAGRAALRKSFGGKWWIQPEGGWVIARDEEEAVGWVAAVKAGWASQDWTVRGHSAFHRVANSAARLTLWELTFPGELRSLPLTRSGATSAVLIRREWSRGGEAGMRLRASWDLNSGRSWSPPEWSGALQVDITF